MKTYNVFLKHPFTMLIAGPTGSGKTRWIQKLINNNEKISYPKPSKIVYCYGEYQNIFSTFKNTEFVDGIPEKIMDRFDGSSPSWLIIDDLMHEISNSKMISEIFTKGSHHRNLSIVLIVQNLFMRGSESRNISLNSQYMVLFKNPRDQSIASSISRQMFPNKIKRFQEAFEDATKDPFSYLFVDLKPNTPNEIRLMKNVLHESEHITVYCL